MVIEGDSGGGEWLLSLILGLSLEKWGFGLGLDNLNNPFTQCSIIYFRFEDPHIENLYLLRITI